MKALTILSILISIMALSLCPTYLHADDFYIDNINGDDTNPGTFQAPWKKIAKANSALRAGDTVYIKAGTYNETIRPANSGTANNYITYTAYQNNEVTIGGNISYGADLHDRSWVRIDGLNFKDTSNFWIQFYPNGSHHFIKNCIFSSTGSSMGWVGLYIKGRADYNKIIGNSFTSACKPLDLVDVRDSSYNLIEKNTFNYAGHTALALQSKGLSTEYNIIRNNTFHNPYHHNLSLFGKANHTLVEGNIIRGAGDACDSDSCLENTCGSDRDRTQFLRENHDGIKVASQYCIIRNNVLINNGDFAIVSWDGNTYSTNNRIYNNTLNANYIGWRTQTSSLNPLSNNLAKNNIFSNHKITNLSFSNAVSYNDNQFINNNFFGEGRVTYKAVSGVSNIETQYPAEWKNNFTVNPGYKDISSDDLTLRSDSKLIDKGDWLTVITSPNGTADSFIVNDSRYFTDGFGIIPGDRIQIQNQSTYARIVSVNYSTHRIVLERPVSWNKGDGVSIPYSGKAPDIGAFEYNNPLCSELLAPTLAIKK